MVAREIREGAADYEIFLRAIPQQQNLEGTQEHNRKRNLLVLAELAKPVGEIIPHRPRPPGEVCRRRGRPGLVHWEVQDRRVGELTMPIRRAALDWSFDSAAARDSRAPHPGGRRF